MTRADLMASVSAQGGGWRILGVATVIGDDGRLLPPLPPAPTLQGWAKAAPDGVIVSAGFEDSLLYQGASVIRVARADGKIATFDIAAGSIASIDPGVVAKLTSVGNGWFRWTVE